MKHWHGRFFHETLRNDWRQRRNGSTTFWERSGGHFYPDKSGKPNSNTGSFMVWGSRGQLHLTLAKVYELTECCLLLCMNCLLCLSLQGRGNKRCLCPSVRLSVCLASVAYMANNSRIQKPSVPKFGRKLRLAHQFQDQRVEGQD